MRAMEKRAKYKEEFPREILDAASRGIVTRSYRIFVIASNLCKEKL